MDRRREAGRPTADPLLGKEGLPPRHIAVQAPQPTPASSAGRVRPTPGNGGPDSPSDGQLDRPWLRPTSEEGAPRAPKQPPAPRWKAPARPRLAQRKATPPAAWGQEQGHNHGAGAVQSHLQATAAAGPGAVRPRAAELRPLQATRTPRAQEGTVAAEEGQGRQAGGQEARKRGPEPRRPPKGEDQLGQAAPIWALQGVKWPRQEPTSANHTNVPSH